MPARWTVVVPRAVLASHPSVAIELRVAPLEQPDEPPRLGIKVGQCALSAFDTVPLRSLLVLEDEPPPAPLDRLTGLLFRVWRENHRDPAGEPGELQAFAAWWLFEGRHTIAGTVVPDALCASVHEPEGAPVLGGRLGMTPLMAAVHTERPDLRSDYPLRDAAGEEAFVAWFFARGVTQLRLADAVTPRQRQLLLAECRRPDIAPGITTLMRALWLERPDVRAVFDISTPAGVAGFIEWCQRHGIAEHGLTWATAPPPVSVPGAAPRSRLGFRFGRKR
jgi:hypothetical protein